MKEETSLDARYRAEGWGNLAAEAIGIRPQDVESQARSVARHASNLLAAVTLERDQLRAKLAEYEKALEPFAEVADCDIGFEESNADFFKPINPRFSRAPAITVGDMRRASAAIRSRTGGENE